MVAGIVHIPAEAQALPCEGGIGSCVLQSTSMLTPVIACLKDNLRHAKYGIVFSVEQSGVH